MSQSHTLVYKFVELGTVDDRAIEAAVNEWVQEGWQFDGMHFAMSASSRRPTMAFLAFTRAADRPSE